VKAKILIIVIVLGFILITTCAVHADATMTQITHNAYEDTFPHMKDHCLVWQGYVNGNCQIFYYDIAAKAGPTQMTSDSYDHLNPQTDGRYIVWWADNASGAEIWLHDTQTQQKIEISPPDGRHHYLPVIANGRVAWMGFVPGDTIIRDIFLFDVSSGLQQLTNDNLDHGAPRINDTEVMWVQADDQDHITVLVHDLATGDTFEAPEGYIWEDSPQRDGFLRGLTRYDGHDWEIVLWNKHLKGFEAITDNALDDGHPCISSGHVAWTAGGEIFLAEYKYLGLSSPTDHASLPKSPPPTFLWESIGYDQFKVQFSKDPGFLTFTFTLPFDKETWLSETRLTLTKWQWRTMRKIQRKNGSVYWRVQGKDAGGNVSLSDTRSFMIYKWYGQY